MLLFRYTVIPLYCYSVIQLFGGAVIGLKVKLFRRFKSIVSLKKQVGLKVAAG